MTSDTFDLGATIDQVVAALREHGVRCFVTGSIAGSMHGEFRATNDIDIVADRKTFLKVDVFPAAGEFERQAIERAVYFSLPGAAHRLSVASLEDIVLAKLRWYRVGGEESGVQRRDTSRLIELNRDDFDLDYMRTWAARLGVADLLSLQFGL